MIVFLFYCAWSKFSRRAQQSREFSTEQLSTLQALEEQQHHKSSLDDGQDVSAALTEGDRDLTISNAITEASDKRIHEIDIQHKWLKDQLQKDKGTRRADFDRDKDRLSDLSKIGHDAIDRLSNEETKRHNERMQMYSSSMKWKFPLEYNS